MPNGDTMKTVKLTEILGCYDGILAFTAQNPTGGHQAGSIVERTREIDHYIIAGTRPEHPDDLRNRKVDLHADSGSSKRRMVHHNTGKHD